MTDETSEVERQPWDKVRAAIEFIRGCWDDDGAEGESIHLICDDLERAEATIATLRAEMDEAVSKYTDGLVYAAGLEKQLAERTAEVKALRAERDGAKRNAADFQRRILSAYMEFRGTDKNPSKESQTMMRKVQFALDARPLIINRKEKRDD